MNKSNHKDGCDGKDFTHSGSGYDRVRLCSCGAEDHDPEAADKRLERIRRRALRFDSGAFDQASTTIVNNLVPYWSSVFRKFCEEEGISRHEAMDLTIAMMTAPYGRD